MRQSSNPHHSDVPICRFSQMGGGGCQARRQQHRGQRKKGLLPIFEKILRFLQIMEFFKKKRI